MRRTFLVFILSSFLLFVFYQNARTMGQVTSGKESEARVAIGNILEFPPGSIKVFSAAQIIVFSDKEGVYAISGRCTHKGCMVKKEGSNWFCPCHASKFDSSGAVLHGPAKKHLPWFSVEMDKEGHLFVDKAKIVPSGTKFKFSPPNPK